MLTSRGATTAESLGFQPKVTNNATRPPSRGATTSGSAFRTPAAASRLVRFDAGSRDLGLKPEATS
ncbi:hypothetical protein RISK_005090 [Rhodopirellula islandica]|uniref:Uncharacterized protein n=1 Tax=Rhodopirellula islandica TaxID=595434 RepID=A0A0J1EB10_RHOIS|nr:hypothetical protein RISK_005090 [Rhodopirellula islandica]